MMGSDNYFTRGDRDTRAGLDEFQAKTFALVETAMDSINGPRGGIFFLTFVDEMESLQGVARSTSAPLDLVSRMREREKERLAESIFS